MAVEVRRHGAPVSRAGLPVAPVAAELAVQDAVGEAAVAPSKILETAAPAAPPVHGATVPGVGVSSHVHNRNTTITNKTHNSNVNFGNTSIVLL